MSCAIFLEQVSCQFQFGSVNKLTNHELRMQWFYLTFLGKTSFLVQMVQKVTEFEFFRINPKNLSNIAKIQCNDKLDTKYDMYVSRVCLTNQITSFMMCCKITLF